MLIYFTVVSFILGAIIGSFTNCFLWRLHEDETLLGRSYCPKCRHKIFWYDNIPIISFFILGGHCRKCHKKISWQYPLVEFATACLFALAFYLTATKMSAGFPDDSLLPLADNGFTLELVKNWLIIFTAMAIFVYDWRWYLIPDRVILPAAVLVFILNLSLGLSWSELLSCTLIGGCFFLFQFLVSNGRWVGGGDIRLGLFLGAATGKLDEFILALLLTYSIGAIIGTTLVVVGKKEWGSKVPLGVFMMPAIIITMFFGQKIIAWYFSLLS
jgi:prepilin signal peptidase PulO-like enzyme (type II secretory pathway)